MADVHKIEKVPSATVSVALADKYVIGRFLDQFGKVPHMVTYWEDSEDARTEAVSLARITLEDVRRRQDEAETDEEEEALEDAAKAARRALRDAKAMPSTRRQVTMPTGRTIAQEWEFASPAARVTMLKSMGVWRVQPGRMPIEQKVSLDERLVPQDRIIADLIPFESLG